MDELAYAALPDQLVVRELLVQVSQPGFRVRSYVLVTTLLDPQCFSAADLAGLYRARWQAELDLRAEDGAANGPFTLSNTVDGPQRNRHAPVSL